MEIHGSKNYSIFSLSLLLFSVYSFHQFYILFLFQMFQRAEDFDLIARISAATGAGVQINIFELATVLLGDGWD